MIMDNENFNVEFGEVVNIGGGTSDFNQLSNRPKYNNATMTGDTNIPKVPTKTSELNNDSDYQTGTEVSSAIDTAVSGLDIPTKTSDLTNDGSDGTSTYVESDDLATVATSGSYNDLSNTPTIPESQVQSDWSQTDNTKVDFIKNKPTIPSAQVNADWNASSGVAEILNKPTIPTVNDATLTITQNGTTKGTFTANDADDTTIEVSDTTYSAFTGTDGTATGVAGLVPAPATTDAGKFLKADGTWDTAGGGSGPTVVQTTGTSTTDVMSQNAATSMVFADPATATKVSIGNANAGTSAVSIGQSAYGAGEYSVALGYQANTYNGARAVAIGQSARARASNAIAIGYNANSGQNGGASSVAVGSNTQTGVEAVSIGENAGSGEANTVAVGRNSEARGRGSVAIGDGSVMPSGYVRGTVSFYTNAIGYGYNGSSNYRLLTGLYDAQGDHDAVTLGQLNGRVTQNAGAPTTSTVGTVGQLIEDTTNGKLYICTDATNPYVWEEVGAGGGSGPTVVQTTGTSQTDVMSQNATTRMIFADPANKTKVQIGGTANSGGTNAVAIGNDTDASSDRSVALGPSARVANSPYSIALAYGAVENQQGVFQIGLNRYPGQATSGYNNSAYRLLTGLYDPQSAHDATTKGYVDPTTGSSAPTTATVGRLGQIQIDTTTATAYMCVAVDTVTPAYTWKQITA